jgi:hypothetical protein
MRIHYMAVGLALCFGLATAQAQRTQSVPALPAQPQAPGVSSHIVDPDAPDDPPKTEQPTAGHDDVSGKDEISSPTDSSKPAPVTTDKHPDFAALDQNNRGYLTMDDVKYNPWLSSNFSRCDTNHDGHLSQQEYANCR